MNTFIRKVLPVLATLFILSISTLCFAEPVSLREAQDVAVNWMRKISGASLSNISIADLHIETEQDVPVYYIFNINPSGFIIISADDAAHPILGYSLKGWYTPGNNPPAFKEWMNRRKKQIFQIRGLKLPRLPLSEKGGRLWHQLRVYPTLFNPLIDGRMEGDSLAETDIAPLLSTKWGQGRYYNAECPTSSGGIDGHCVVGCVATAMGQIMKYWNYPTTGNSSHSYTDDDEGLQSANFGATIYNWGAMPNSLSNYNAEVARLLYHSGVSIDMDYEATSSAASTAEARGAYVNYFRYSRAANYVCKNSFPSDGAWDTMLRTELDNGRPVHYRGESGSAGHSFVIDGYQYTDFFHINWGWTGTSDGYYYLQSASPLILYPNYQCGIKGMIPLNQMPEPNLLNVTVPSQVPLGEYIEIYIESENIGSSGTYGGIIVSFPNFTGANDGEFVDYITSSSGITYREYGRNQSIWHKNGYSLSANYLMVEMEHPSWLSDSLKFLRIRVYPQQAGTFTFYVRSEMGYLEAYINSPITSTYKDQQGWEVRRYTVNVCSIPGTPSLVSPSNGATGVSTTPTLDWNIVSGATSYDVQVCNDSGCSSVTRSSNVGVSEWTVTPALNPGTTYYWRARGKNSCGEGSYSGTRSFTTAGQTLPILSDFDRDGDPDLLWWHKGTGEIALWWMNGLNPVGPQGIARVPDTNWKIAGVGDFDRDGDPDILWQHQGTGEVALWYMNGASPVSPQGITTVPDTNWKIVGVGDFDRDGDPDILWRHQGTGEIALWYMNGASPVSPQGIATVPINWKIVGVGDFDRDGDPDILWQHQLTGEVALWYMNGPNPVSPAGIATVPANWKIMGVADFNRDGNPDILWRHQTTGEIALWYMNGLNLVSPQGMATVPDLNWEIVAP